MTVHGSVCPLSPMTKILAPTKANHSSMSSPFCKTPPSLGLMWVEFFGSHSSSNSCALSRTFTLSSSTSTTVQGRGCPFPLMTKTFAPTKQNGSSTTYSLSPGTSCVSGWMCGECFGNHLSFNSPDSSCTFTLSSSTSMTVQGSVCPLWPMTKILAPTKASHSSMSSPSCKIPPPLGLM